MTRWQKWVLTWDLILEPFRVFKHAREARAQERRQADERLMRFTSEILSTLTAQQQSHVALLQTSATALTEQAAGFKEWMLMISKAQGEPTSSIVTPEAEALAERKAAIADLLAHGFPVDKTPEEQLRYLIAMEQDS